MKSPICYVKTETSLWCTQEVRGILPPGKQRLSPDLTLGSTDQAGVCATCFLFVCGDQAWTLSCWTGTPAVISPAQILMETYSESRSLQDTEETLLTSTIKPASYYLKLQFSIFFLQFSSGLKLLILHSRRGVLSKTSLWAWGMAPSVECLRYKPNNRVQSPKLVETVEHREVGL